MFSHERLKVYDKTLACVTTLMEYSSSWDKRHSVVDHLARASESIVLNLAEATRLRNIGHKQHTLEYAIGSALESAACLDIAERNGRYPEGERQSFLDIAEASTVKAAAYLDLCAHKAELKPDQRECGVQLLERIAMMLRGLSLN